MLKSLFLALIAGGTGLCSLSSMPAGASTEAAVCAADPEQPLKLEWQIVARYPHDANAYTQGLYFADGYLYESTGRWGESSLRKVELTTGKVRRKHSLAERYFGEGAALLDGRIYQLTWRARTGFVYEADSFQLIKSFRYETEGWGLTEDGERLVMSDGTANLYFLDPESLEVVRELMVCREGVPLRLLNELEYIEGLIYANIFMSNEIVVISPVSGTVLAAIDLTALAAEYQPMASDAVLNGIAYDAQADRIFVTGKLWPYLFELAISREALKTSYVLEAGNSE